MIYKDLMIIILLLVENRRNKTHLSPINSTVLFMIGMSDGSVVGIGVEGDSVGERVG